MQTSNHKPPNLPPNTDYKSASVIAQNTLTKLIIQMSLTQETAELFHPKLVDSQIKTIEMAIRLSAEALLGWHLHCKWGKHDGPQNQEGDHSDKMSGDGRERRNPINLGRGKHRTDVRQATSKIAEQTKP